MDEHGVPWGRGGSFLFDEKQCWGKKGTGQEMKGNESNCKGRDKKALTAPGTEPTVEVDATGLPAPV